MKRINQYGNSGCLKLAAILLMALIMGSGCSTTKVKEERFYSEDRENEVVQAFLAENMPGTSESFRMVASAELNEDLSPDQRTEAMLEAYLSLIQEEAALSPGVPVAELGIGDILSTATGTGFLADLLRGVVEFGADYLTKERVPQPLNIFRQSKFGRYMYRKYKEERDKY